MDFDIPLDKRFEIIESKIDEIIGFLDDRLGHMEIEFEIKSLYEEYESLYWKQKINEDTNNDSIK